MKVGVIRFPGTNCDQDCLNWALKRGHDAKFAWHLDQFSVDQFDMLILPGGFSYGDYLRSGALAAQMPVMKSIKEFAASGKPVIGICNGFQILCEAGLLPGVLVQNEKGRFNDQLVELEVVNTSPKFAPKLQKSQKIKLPVAHGDGRFYADHDELQKIEANGQVWLRYTAAINGAVSQIAGVMNEKKNVFGLMPHPERASETWMGSIDGLEFI